MLKFRKAKNSDIEFLLNLRKVTMHEHLLNAGIKLDGKGHLDRVLYEFGCAEIIIFDCVEVGLLKVNRSQDPWKLIQIQITPEGQGHGLGEKIIKNLVAEANNNGMGVELSVLRENQARKLYENCDFSVIDEKDCEYIMRTTT